VPDSWAMERVSFVVQTLVRTYVATVVFLVAIDKPDDFWGTKQWAVWLALIAVVLEGIVPLYQRYRRDRAAQFRLDVEETLKAVVIAVTDAGPYWRNVGVHAFIMERPWYAPWKPRQVRMGRWRMTMAPEWDEIVWTKDKGVIGKCWRDRRGVRADLHKQWKEFYGCSKETWNALDDELRFGFTYEDFVNSRQAEGKNLEYGVILAYPILDRRKKYRGCVSVDVPAGHGRALDQIDVRNAALMAAATISKIMSPKQRP
jgi:hypothetical protein